jgi:hypothetical protein
LAFPLSEPAERLQHDLPLCQGYRRPARELAAQIKALTAAGPAKVFRETASGTKTDRAQLRKVLAVLDAGDVLMVTPPDQFARSTRDLLNILAAVTDRKAIEYYGVGRKLTSNWIYLASPSDQFLNNLQTARLGLVSLLSETIGMESAPALSGFQILKAIEPLDFPLEIPSHPEPGLGVQFNNLRVGWNVSTHNRAIRIRLVRL